jgi:hypothetical protein
MGKEEICSARSMRLAASGSCLDEGLSHADVLGSLSGKDNSCFFHLFACGARRRFSVGRSNRISKNEEVTPTVMAESATLKAGQ